ncbi:uncharacterized protein AB675_8049 [Cyphellophora attinorum]|uniref:Uncharacterized protein n=1 Tax=Cyphellophora attinorum TaxID=1664694 RepID=A0A0N1H5P1_9EURO|nr:uncharacterized protein AB675_8049 [Phialophora attinorum]KPI41097.1 hypothetical protein AB675_8049 [Phialophora attinorum]
MAFQFSNSIPVTSQVRQPKSSESIQSFAQRQRVLRQPPSAESVQAFAARKALDAYKRDVGNVPTLYNIETKEPLPLARAKGCWSETSTEVDSQSPHSSFHRSWNLPLWWTAALTVIPVLAFTATFIALIAAHRITTDSDSPFSNEQHSSTGRSNILVQFSSTRLVFIAGFGSTVAPMILGSLMTLWHYPTSLKLFESSSEGDTNRLPTPQQLSMLIGLSAGSLEALRKYVLYRCRRFRAKKATILTSSAAILLASAILAGLVLLADVGIHNFTSTVPISLSIVEHENIGSNGRGLAPHCIGFDRGNAIAFDSGEIIAMGANRSKINSAWQAQDPENPAQDLILLTPQPSLLDSDQDFVASTVAVSTQCFPSTQQCNVRVHEGDSQNDTYILFNCTENFRGVLGAPETLAADTVTWTRTDSTTPDFNFKLDRNFQRTWRSSRLVGRISLPDDKLLTTYYLAIAGLVPVQNNAEGQALLADSPSALALPGSPLIAYTLNCSVTAHDVNYTWSNNAIHSLTSHPTTNGSILELAHSMQAMGMPSLSQAQSLASLTDSMTSFARSYANLHSQDTIALIASVMTPRTNIDQARRSSILVASVPLWAFMALVAANSLFVLFALVLAVRALYLSSPETRDMVAKLSVEGLAAAAFEDRGGKQDPGGIVADPDEMFEESRIGVASRRIALRRAVGGTVALRIEQPHL